MNRSLRARLARLEGGRAEMPAEALSVLSVLLASRRERAGIGRMSGEERAIYEAPGFHPRAEAALRSLRARKPDPESVGEVAAILDRGLADARRAAAARRVEAP